MSPQSNGRCPYKSKAEGDETDRRGGHREKHKKEGHVRMEAEIRIMQLQIKEHQMILAAIRNWNRTETESPPAKSPAGMQICGHLDFELLAFRTGRE